MAHAPPIAPNQEETVNILIKRAVVATAAAGTMLIPATAASAAPVVTGGLVNVTLVDVLDVNNNQVIVQVPISVAAAVCDVNVAVLGAIQDTGGSFCTATSSAVADATQQRTRRNG